MPENPPQRATVNRILAGLSRADFGLLEPHLEAVELPARKRLEIRDTPIDHIYFIEGGLASVLATVGSERSIEVGLIGREGMTGLAVVLAADRSPHETFMQMGGHGRRVGAADLRRAMEQSASLHRCLLHYGHAFFVQTAHTAMANGRSKIEERLARWLLMAHDRIDGDQVTLTHEFLARMLGVRRPGVTVALNFLEKRGLVQAHRGVISIIDREGLEASAKGVYGGPEAEFQRLFG